VSAVARALPRRALAIGHPEAVTLVGFVLVSGAPGSGKSTLAPALAARLGLPLFAKDTIKEALMDALEVPDRDTSRRFGAAAVRVLLALAAENGRGVLESNWRASVALGDLRALPGPVVEVHCAVSPEISRARYAQRAGTRHAGHFDDARAGDESMWSGEASRPVSGGWPVVSVDSSVPFDIEAVAASVHTAMSEFG
jgi:predicted kinase